MPPPDALINRCEAELDRCEAIARRHWQIRMKRPALQWDLRGRTAGQYRSDHVIRLNSQLAHQIGEAILETLAHEYAHAVAEHLRRRHRARREGDWRPHGAVWQTIMHAFGYQPQRCHEFDLAPARTHPRPWLYRCNCQTHRLTTQRHNKIRRGTQYLCRSCGQPLNYQGREE